MKPVRAVRLLPCVLAAAAAWLQWGMPHGGPERLLEFAPGSPIPLLLADQDRVYLLVAEGQQPRTVTRLPPELATFPVGRALDPVTVGDGQARVVGGTVYYLRLMNPGAMPGGARYVLHRRPLAGGEETASRPQRWENPVLSARCVYWLDPLPRGVGLRKRSVMTAPLEGGPARKIGESFGNLRAGDYGVCWDPVPSGAPRSRDIVIYREKDGSRALLRDFSVLFTAPAEAAGRFYQITELPVHGPGPPAVLSVAPDGSDARRIPIPTSPKASISDASGLTWHRNRLYCLLHEVRQASDSGSGGWIRMSLCRLRPGPDERVERFSAFASDYVQSAVYARGYLYYVFGESRENWLDFSQEGLRRRRAPVVCRWKLPAEPGLNAGS